MGKPFNKKITWVIKNFSSLKSDQFYSDKFVVDGCICMPIPWGKDNDHLSLFLEVGNYESLPIGWRRHAKYSFTISNQSSEKLSRKHESQQWFEKKSPGWGRLSIMPLNELHAKDAGFLVNGDLKIVVEIDVLEVVGRLDVTEETSTIIETMDVNGFQILPSHAISVSRMFERHSELASEFRPKNPNLRTAYISFLLSLIETMCQSPQELSQDDLTDAYAAMGFMRDAGFKLDWLEKKLDEVSEKKKNEKSSEAGLQEMEEDLRDLKRKCSDMEDLVKKEKFFLTATEHWFDAEFCDFGFTTMLPLDKIHDKDGGFLVNGDLEIVAEVEVLEVIGKLDVSEETKLLSKVEEDDGAEARDSLELSVNGFQVLPSQLNLQVIKKNSAPIMWNGDGTVEFNGFRVLYSEVEYVRRIFERHPETAMNLRPKNQLVKNAYMNTLLDLIDIVCLAPQELTEEELRDAESTLMDLVGVGFELDWLKRKLEELCVKKTKMEARGARMRELDRMIVEQRQVLLALEVERKNEENEAVSDSARLGFEDVV
ncbi:unnamed protein product [Brassica oleracea]